MNIARFFLYCIGEDQVNEFDNRSVLGRPFKGRDINIFFIADYLDILHLQVAHYIGQRSGLVIELINRSFDGGLGSDNHFHIVTGHEFNIVNRENIRGIAHGDDQGGTCPVDRYDLIFLGYVNGDRLYYRGIYFKFSKIDGRNTILFGQKKK